MQTPFCLCVLFARLLATRQRNGDGSMNRTILSMPTSVPHAYTMFRPKPITFSECLIEQRRLEQAIVVQTRLLVLLLVEAGIGVGHAHAQLGSALDNLHSLPGREVGCELRAVLAVVHQQ
jgi:hypothetical protein